MRRDVALAGLGFWLLVSALVALMGGRARADSRSQSIAPAAPVAPAAPGRPGGSGDPGAVSWAGGLQ